MALSPTIEQSNIQIMTWINDIPGHIITDFSFTIQLIKNRFKDCLQLLSFDLKQELSHDLINISLNTGLI